LHNNTAEKIILDKRKMVKPVNSLANAWTMWCDTLNGDNHEAKSGYYGQRLEKICSMDSVESFHQYYSYLKGPDTLPKGSTLYIFRDKLVPMWETFPEGACWTFKLNRDDSRLNHVWEDTFLSCIGEGLGSHNVAGIVLASRPREFSISVWLVSAEGKFEIMEHIRKIWRLVEGDGIQFKDFKSSIRDGSSKLNALSYRVKDPAHATGAEKKKFLLPDPIPGTFAFN